MKKMSPLHDKQISKYSIRKTTTRATSLLIGTTLIFGSFAPALTVAAETDASLSLKESQESLPDESIPSSEEEVVVDEVTEITSDTIDVESVISDVPVSETEATPVDQVTHPEVSEEADTTSQASLPEHEEDEGALVSEAEPALSLRRSVRSTPEVVTARDIFDLEGKIKSNLTFFNDPTPSYASLETFIAQVATAQANQGNYVANDYTKDSYQGYTNALTKASNKSSEVQTAVTKGKEIQSQSAGYSAELSALIDAKRADMAYNTVTQEEKQAIYNRLSEIFSVVNYQTEYMTIANILEINQVTTSLDRAVRGLTPTIAKELSDDGTFDTAIEEKAKISVNHFGQLTSHELEKISQLLIDTYFLDAFSPVISYQNQQVIITYPDDDSVTVLPISAVAIATNPVPVEPITTTKEESRTEPVAFETERRANPDLEAGKEQVVQAGQAGERTIVERVILVDGKETKREEISNTITKPTVNEIVEYGTKEATPETTTKEESRTEPVAFETERRANPDLEAGKEQVVQAGQAGERTIVERVTLVDGKETKREEISNTITKPAVNEIVEYGTKEATSETETTTQEETSTENQTSNNIEITTSQQSETQTETSSQVETTEQGKRDNLLPVKPFETSGSKESAPLARVKSNQGQLPSTGDLASLFIPLSLLTVTGAGLVLKGDRKRKD